MRQVPLERDINIAVNGCSWFATSTQKGPFTAMLISHSRGTYLIHATYAHLTLAWIQVEDGVQHCGQQEQDHDEGDCNDDGEVGEGPGEATLGG